MTSKRRASTVQKDFANLIFGNDYLTLPLCAPVYNQLLRDPSQIARLLADEDLLLKFLSNFDLYASRITQFFGQLHTGPADSSNRGARRASCVGPGVADQLVDSVLLPLLRDDFQQFQQKPAFLALFTVVIEFCLSFRPRSFEILAKNLGRVEALLEALVAGETSNRVMRDWIDIFSITIFDFKIIGVWSKRLIAQCRRCESNHGVSEQIRAWQRLDGLISRLTDMIPTRIDDSRSLPGLQNLRRLNDADKKSGVTTGAQKSSFELPPDVSTALQNFQIPPPMSVRALRNALEKLEKDEMLGVLRAIVDSYPCRPCYNASINPSAVKSYDRYEEENWETSTAKKVSSPLLFTDLLGRGLGIWRVFLSSQALKDVEESRFEGNFKHIQSKLTQLASGDWRRKSLCGPAGNQSERKSCHGILYEAVYGSNGRVLWQTDVEFDEGSGTEKQLVKVWKIGDVKEIAKSIPYILQIHKAYSPSRMDACKRISVDEATGLNLPVMFSESVSKIAKAGASGQQDLETLFQSNKFYMVTQTTIDNLVSQNMDAEFPLVLSQEELGIIKNSRTSTLILGRSGTGKTTCLVYKLLGRYLAANHLKLARPRRQVLLTRSSVLSNKLEVYTKRLIATQLNKANTILDDNDDALHFIAQDDREVNDTVFSIKDEDFPLICTFNHFVKLLENTVRSSNRKDFSVNQKPVKFEDASIGKRNRRQLFRRAQVVDFGIFSEEYWPSFPTDLTGLVPVELAFMEIIGVIKGSACNSINFLPLGRGEYKATGHRISPVSADRDLLYNIYECYEKLKRKLGDVDDVDRARLILETISNNSDLREKVERAFDEVYVDEIQDQKLLEIEMLLHLIKSPIAIHFAGDTAQCVAKDSVFRFQNVKDLLFQHFSPISTASNSPELARPKLCKLYKNYRTHQGILSLASHVMGLLCRCFPRMVDTLPNEEGQFSGPRPIVFVGLDSQTFSSRMVGVVDLHANSAQFGAEQVIIVRDTADKKKLKDTIGEFALILTIMESKGMEFEDVLLFDFFTTSQCTSIFRLLADSREFDESKNIALCSELKQLYVAITRARNRLWLFESNESSFAPVMRLWAANEPIIEVAYGDDDDISEKLKQLRPGTTANPKTWSAKGYEFIHKKDYENALFCFKRAKDTKGQPLANAFIAEKKGRGLLASGNEDLSEISFRDAIKLFHECRLPLREAACYETIGMFESAADIFSLNGEYGRAAELFDKIDSFKKAAQNYSLAKRYNEGASALGRGSLYDSLVHYLNDYGSLLDKSCRLHYSRLCNLLLRRGKISPELEGLTRAALGSDSEREAFFLGYEMTDQLFSFYIEQRKYLEAFNLAVKNCDLDKAWKVIEMHGDDCQLPQRQKIEVFNYVQMKYLLASLAGSSMELFPFSTTWGLWLPDNLSVQDFWRDLGKTIGALLGGKISYDSIRFADTWMKQLFDIIVTFKARAFINSAQTMRQLPIESINGVLEMIKDAPTAENIPTPLLLFLRVLPVPHEVGSYTILDSSPLLTEPSSSPQTLDSAGAWRAIALWTLGQLAGAIDELEPKSLYLYKLTYPVGCAFLLAKGACLKPPGQCPFSHRNQISAGEYSVLIDDLLRVNSVFCNLLPVYYRGFGGQGFTEGFSKNFRGRQRRWLESLLARITYVSPLENAPKILASTKRAISRGDTRHFGIFGGLESLLFHRLGKNWGDISDFSSMLEQVQIAETLGVKSRFQWSLQRNAWDSRYLQVYYTWIALRDIEANLGAGVNLKSVKAIHTVLQNVETWELCSYHAVASLYEKMATFMEKICMSHPSDFLLPDGWVEMYMLQMPQLFDPERRVSSWKLRLEYRQGLLTLIRSFCSLVSRIEVDPNFHHKFSGKHRPWELLVRRNVDFLATCVLNAFSWQDTESHFEYVQTLSIVQKTFDTSFANAPKFRDCTENYLARNFIRSFEIYAGNDIPLIIKDTKSTTPFFGFLGSDVQIMLLESLQSPAPTQVETAPTRIAAPVDGEPGDYTQLEVAAAGAIQRMWRTRCRVFQRRREFFKSPSGQALSYIRRICNKVLEGSSLSRKEKIWRTGVLYSDGLDVYQHAKAIEKEYLKVKKAVMSRINNADPDKMEDFQDQWERVLGIREHVRRNVGFLSVKNWEELDIPGKELSKKCRETLRVLKGIEAALHQIMKE